VISILIVAITLIVTIGVATNKNMFFWWRLAIAFGVFYIGLFLLRFLVFGELWMSDMYETMKETDYILPLDSIWNIFDIDYDYPYICYFKNGFKGVFVRMEKDAITGKPEEAMFDHYQAIGDAYNLAHSLNMNIIHIDYMDNVGNDPRMQKLYDDLNFVENPHMQRMLIDIYANLQDEMARNYSSFDVYLFLTKDKKNNFIYNIQSVCNRMLGANFITYKVLDRIEIAKVCTSLFNLHEFSIVDACENVLQGEGHNGIIPINVTHGDGTVEEFNKTMAEKKIIADERARKLRERQEEEAKKKANMKRKKKLAKKNGGIIEEDEEPIDDTELDLFSAEIADDDSDNLPPEM
jgi:ribosomal protein S21